MLSLWVLGAFYRRPKRYIYIVAEEFELKLSATRIHFTISPSPLINSSHKGGQVVLLGTLDREATKETPVDGFSAAKNPMLGRRSLVFLKVWQPECRL